MTYVINGTDYKNEVEEAREKIFDPMAEDVAENLILSLQNSVAPLSYHIGGIVSPGATFVENIASTIHTVSMLYNTLYGNVLMEQYGKLQEKHRDEAKKRLGIQQLTEQQEKSVQELALNDIESAEEINSAKIWTLHRVNLIWHQSVIAMSGPQILRQGIVLLWGAFEVLSTDLFKAAASAEKVLLDRILLSDDVRNDCMSKVKKVDWKASNWLQNRERVKMNGINSMLKAYQATLPTDCNGLSPATMWFTNPHLVALEQKRHLIVHRAAIKDADYLSKTSDLGSVGDELVITPVDFRSYAEAVARIGTEMLQAVDAELIKTAP